MLTRLLPSTSGKLCIGKKLSVVVLNEYATSLEGNETFIRLDNDTSVYDASSSPMSNINK